MRIEEFLGAGNPELINQFEKSKVTLERVDLSALQVRLLLGEVVAEHKCALSKLENLNYRLSHVRDRREDETDESIANEFQGLASFERIEFGPKEEKDDYYKQARLLVPLVEQSISLLEETLETMRVEPDTSEKNEIITLHADDKDLTPEFVSAVHDRLGLPEWKLIAPSEQVLHQIVRQSGVLIPQNLAA